MTTFAPRRCLECGAPIETRARRCPPRNSACNKAWHNRRLKRGLGIVDLAMTWREGRGTTKAAKKAYSDLCFVLDGYLREDKNVGRVRHNRDAPVLRR